MTQLRQQEQRFEQLDARVVVVTFDDSPLARAYIAQTALQWPLLLDHRRSLYRAYQMDQLSRWAIYGPASVWHYLKLLTAGRRLQRPGKDWRQAGGDVLVDPEGIVRFHFVSTSPHDRPEAAELLRVMESLSV